MTGKAGAAGSRENDVARTTENSVGRRSGVRNATGNTRYVGTALYLQGWSGGFGVPTNAQIAVKAGESGYSHS